MLGCFIVAYCLQIMNVFQYTMWKVVFWQVYLIEKQDEVYGKSNKQCQHPHVVKVSRKIILKIEKEHKYTLPNSDTTIIIRFLHGFFFWLFPLWSFLIELQIEKKRKNQTIWMMHCNMCNNGERTFCFTLCRKGWRICNCLLHLFH